MMIDDMRRLGLQTPELPFPNGFAEQLAAAAASGVQPALAAPNDEMLAPGGDVEPV
jgi:hypothetical protein